MDGFSPDFFLYWNLILLHLCTGYHGRRLRIPLNMSISLFLDINVPSTVYHLFVTETRLRDEKQF